MARVPTTQDKLAPSAGMSQSTLSRRLTGETAFNTDELARLAAALGLQVELRLIPAATADMQGDELAVSALVADGAG